MNRILDMYPATLGAFTRDAVGSVRTAKKTAVSDARGSGA